MIKTFSLLSIFILLSTENTVNAQKINKLKNENLKNKPKSQLVFSQTPSNASVDDEKEEFRSLMKESSEIHDKKAVKLLNNIFNSNNKKESESVLLVHNNSYCDIILRLQGNRQYNLAVPSKGENFISIKKDSYLIKGRVCNSQYLKTKDLTSNQILTLNYSESIKN